MGAIFSLHLSGLYLHIPFCRRACSYCDFYFATTKTLIPEFVDAIIREIRQSPDNWRRETVNTVYFGGGTPSLLPVADLKRILTVISEMFTVDPAAEVTLEANPEDISGENCSAWLLTGINRLSLGVQTFQPAALKWMNRPHSPEAAREAIRTVSNAGFRSFSCDLIYALPGESAPELITDIHELLVFHPPHISAYALTVEPGTRLNDWIKRGTLNAQDDEAAAGHMEVVSRHLGGAGYSRYEVSNFCLPGHESRHNSAYWKHRNYFGFGPGAHSFMVADDKKQGVRWSNPAQLNRYVKTERFSDHRISETVGPVSLAEECVYLGLRTSMGFNLEDLQRLGIDTAGLHENARFNRLLSDGLLQKNGTMIALTGEGFTLADGIALDLIASFRASH